MSFAFDFNANPEFSRPELNAPRPCKHAANCFYGGEGGCAFVHPGEEGTGLQLFPSRSVKDPETGKEIWQKATVRLIGSAKFYERRRLKMSWPQWCSLPKNAHLPKPSKKNQPVNTTALPIDNAILWCSLEQAASANTCVTHVNPALELQHIGNILYSMIQPFLNEVETDMKAGGIWNAHMTPGKVTGMLLEGIEREELIELTKNTDMLKQRIADCCVLIHESF